MTEIIVYSDPLEAWMWTHPEISVPTLLAITIVGLMLYKRKTKSIRNRQGSVRNNQKWRW